MKLRLGRELSVAALLGAIFISETLFQRKFKCSPILGQLFAGIVLGPALLNIVVEEDALRLLGKLGIMVLVTHGGMQVDIDGVRKIGARAFIAAATGVAMPVVLCIAFLVLLFNESPRVGLAAGAAIAPTSLGFSAKLLSEVGRMDTPEGVMICTAAVVDDVIALVLLTEIQALSKTNASAWDIASPLVGSTASIFFGLILATSLSKRLPKFFEDRFRDEKRRMEAKLVCLTCLSLLCAFLCASVRSSDLLGCFIAGLAFSGDPSFEAFWNSQVKRLERWGAALFFAATIAFGVPSLTKAGGLFDPQSLLRGVFMVIAGVIGKMSLGVWASPLTPTTALTFGAAMMGRGEFSFLIADTAASDDLLSDTNYSAVIWALLVCSFGAPFGFRYMLSRSQAEEARRYQGKVHSASLESTSRDRSAEPEEL